MIMAKIIKRTDSLTEPPLISRLCRQLSPPRGSRIIKNDSLTELPLTTALTGGASPQGEAYFESNN